MDVRRSISCSFWTDEWIESISVEAKLLFLYLLSCPLSNILGIYKISVSRICFDTGMKVESVSKHLKDFHNAKKVLYLDGYIILINHLKHQSLNPNMKVNVVNDYTQLPNELKDKLKTNTYKDFESLSNALQTLSEIEIEKESEKGKGKAKPIKNFPPSNSEEENTITQINFPFDTETFKASWERWKKYKKEQHRFTYKSSDSENLSLKQLFEMSGGVEDVAVKIIEQSIGSGYSGLFKLKINNPEPPKKEPYKLIPFDND